MPPNSLTTMAGHFLIDKPRISVRIWFATFGSDVVSQLEITARWPLGRVIQMHPGKDNLVWCRN